MTIQTANDEVILSTPEPTNPARPAKIVKKTSNSKLPTVSVIVPTLNEVRNIPQVMSAIPNMVDEVVLVDGRSTDGTVELARQLRPDIVVVNQKGKGKGDALREGFAAATGDIIVMIDADGSTDPREITNYVGALLAGADFAKGSRFLQGGGTSDMEWYRYLGNQSFVWMVRILFGGKYTDLCYGYNAFWARTLPMLDLDGDGFEIETMMNVRALQAGLKITEVPSFENRRFQGYSNLQTFPDGFRVLKTIFKEFLKKPWVRWYDEREPSLNQRAFKAAFEAILEDTLKLSKMREKLSEKVFEEGIRDLNRRYVDLLNSETDCEKCKELQVRYKTHYPNMLNKYLEYIK